MSDQHFVYAEFVSPDDATRAVSALVDGSFEPDQIDVLTVHGSDVQRVPLRHHRPVLAGAVFGVLFGMFIGLCVGVLSKYGSDIDAWAWTTRWVLLGAACGFLAGALGGLVWWRSGVQLQGAPANTQRFVVGTIVSDTRSNDVARILETTVPLTTGSYPVSDDEIARQHAARIVVPTP